MGTVALAAASRWPSDEHDLVVVGQRERGVELVEEYARHIGVVPTTLEEAAGRRYDSVLIHSYAHWSGLTQILSSLDCRHVDFYADGLRNELRFSPPHPGIGSSGSLVYFGYALHNELVAGQLGPVDHFVVPLERYGAFWRWLAATHPSPGPRAGDVLGRDDVLVAMRYWGRSRMYPTPSPVTAADVIGQIELPGSTRRVVVRHDPRLLVSFPRILDRVRAVVPSDIEVRTWDETVGYDPSLGSLDVLDRSVFTESWDLAGFFGYDGTPNLLVGALQPRTPVLWPTAETIRSAIVEPRAAAAAIETIRIQRSALEQMREGAEAPEVTTPGLDEAAVLDEIDPRTYAGLEDWTSSEADAVLLAVLDVVGLDESADPGEVVARLHGLLADRLRFERLLHEQSLTVGATASPHSQGASQ